MNLSHLTFGARRIYTILLFTGMTFFLHSSSCRIVLNDPSNVTTVSLSDSDIDTIIESEMAKQNIVGISVGIVENGQVTKTKAYGHKNQLRTDPITTNTVFRYASVSKPVTAIATFKAILDGDLSLNDKVVDHVSDWPSTGSKDDITVAHLLSHRSGINHYGVDSSVVVCTVNSASNGNGNSFNVSNSLDRFKHCNLVSEPGDEYLYSSYAYDLLGAVIEGATGTDYVSYVNEHIKDVGNLTSLQGDVSSPGGFDLDCELKREAKNSGDVSYKIPSGGWCSNISDMAGLMAGTINNDYLITSYVMWQDVSFASPNNDYVYGFKKETKNDTDYVHHGGAHSDVRTFMGFFPGDKNGVVVMMNTGGSGDAKRVGEKLLAAMGYSTSRTDLPKNDNKGQTDCGERILSVHRQTGDAENTIIRRGLNHDEFLAERNFLRDMGWYLIDLETYKDGGSRKWDGIFKNNVNSTSIWRNFSTDSWFDKWEEENEAGRRCIDLEAYKENGVTKWAGLFQSGNGNSYAMWRGFSSEDFSDKYFEMADEGRKLIDVETYKVNGNRKWAGIWLGSGTALLNRNYDQDDFVQLCRDREADGFMLVDVETYEIGNTRKYAGVWEPATENEIRWFNMEFGDWINEEHNEFIEDDYELLDLELMP